MKVGDYVRVREPAQFSRKNPWAYTYVGRLVRVGADTVGVEYEGDDGSTAVFGEKRTSVDVLHPLRWLALDDESGD